jgi:hypothetical protein
MRATKLILAVVTTGAFAGLVNANRAIADEQSIFNPFPNDSVFVNVGEAFDRDANPLGAWAVFYNSRTAECAAKKLDPGHEGWAVFGGNGDDIMIIVGGSGQGPVNLCNDWTMTSFDYSRGFVDIRAGDGRDVIFCGSGDSWCFGDGGNDVIFNYSAVGRNIGGPGDDAVHGTSAVATDWLEGNAGIDCLDDPGDLHSLFDCGVAPDRPDLPNHDFFVPPGSGAIGCDIQVMSCS